MHLAHVMSEKNPTLMRGVRHDQGDQRGNVASSSSLLASFNKLGPMSNKKTISYSRLPDY